MAKIELLHGTDHIIEVPVISVGKAHNDYGQGFIVPAYLKWQRN